ncbi:MAG: hypothetical protein ACRD96_23910, partial [Bryobacteraceae bacterium]
CRCWGGSGCMRAEVRTRASLAESDIAAMWALYETYFEASSERIFREDLEGKDAVVCLLDEAGRLRGFSTLAVLEFPRGRAIFSGDTIVDHRHWGEQTLPVAWCRHAGAIKAERPDEPLYWLLISKGYRTYRYLPLFSRVYYPSWNRPTPPDAQELIDQIARRKFGAAYDARAGVVRFAEPRGQLRGEWADVRPEMLRKPEVRFFVERNPGYRRGDELVCLTELSAANMRSYAGRAFTEALRLEPAAR